MNVPRTWIKIIYLISLIAQIYSNIDSKEHFCGKKLVKTLTELCSIYNNPSFGRNRFRRQIVQECCRSQCSRRYLVQYYCLEANRYTDDKYSWSFNFNEFHFSSSILNLLKTNPENSNKSGFDKDTKNYQADNIRTVAAEEKNSLTVGISQSDGKKTLVLKPKTVHSLSSSHNKTTRGKRNCKCRKRRAKV
ncbi:Insulin domain containing protein [Asbolus verrucosus]|uniref:Insulin domain containing protein n=1 Tax=Asbolus verrucosus TaxID=1661398 RepID=A0A482VKX3_ASBVE|nr:Insulin domain containing protein [Asbolus verrucosus]